MTPVQKIAAYLEGKTTLKNFYDQVIQDEELQNFLEQDASIPPYTNHGNMFLYLMSESPKKARADLNVKDALSKLLSVNGINHSVDHSSAHNYDLILAAAPSWLYLPDEYTAKLIEKLPEGLGRAARLKLLKETIARDFHYLRKPPRWLQDAEWPLADGKPLLFVDQLNMSETMHDDANVYVFFNPIDKSFRTLMQVA